MKKPKSLQFIAILVATLLILQQTGFAQVASVELNIAGHFATLGNTLTPDKFRPLHLRYLSYDESNNNFKVLLDKGDTKNPKAQDIESTSKELLEYFFVGLALPDDAFWVNLRPDAPNDIIDPFLAQTEVGKILLEADLQLKKDTANATNPQTAQGKEYWDKIYQKAAEIYGTQNLTIPTLTRPWIVPDEIIIRDSVDSAYVYKATLKVMLEQDYLKGNATYSFKDERERQLNEYSSQIIREDIIPKLTKEINSAKRYAPLRQVYYSLILAQWFKARNQDKPTQYSNRIDRKDLTNLQAKTPYSVVTYFNAYKDNFAKGEYNIKAPVSTPYGQVIRSYFSGGIKIIAQVPGPGQLTAVNTAGTSFTRVPDIVGHQTDTELLLNTDPGNRDLVPAEVDLQRVDAPARSSRAGDVNLAAGGQQKAAHSKVNNFIRDNLPQDLRENSGNLSNYQQVEGYGVKARVIPIPGLFNATGQFAHLGLGQVYQEPVIYVDADYLTNQTVLMHELYEIAKWEAKRQELGLNPQDMRQWILDNLPEAKALAEKWHNEAPRLDILFFAASRRMQGLLDSLATAAGLPNGTSFVVDKTGSSYASAHFDGKVHILEDLFDLVQKGILTDREFAALLAHEIAHLVAEDPLRGALLERAGMPLSVADEKRLEMERWLQAAEILTKAGLSYKDLISFAEKVKAGVLSDIYTQHHMDFGEIKITPDELINAVLSHKIWPVQTVQIRFTGAAPEDYLNYYEDQQDVNLGAAAQDWPVLLGRAVVVDLPYLELVANETLIDPEEGFKEKVFLLFGTKSAAGYQIQRIIPVSKYIKQTQDLVEVDRAHIAQLIDQYATGQTKMLGVLHTHPYDVTKIVTRPGPSWQDRIGEDFFLPERSEKLVDIPLGIVLEAIVPRDISISQVKSTDRDINAYFYLPEEKLGADSVGVFKVVNFKEWVGQIENPTDPGSPTTGLTTGGIDFRSLPIVAVSLDNLKASIRSIAIGSLQRLDLTQEWSDIKRLVNSGITPSTERLKEYFLASCFKGALGSDMEKIVSCISYILRMQEESCSLTDQALKDILVMLGSGRSTEDLKLAFMN